MTLSSIASGEANATKKTTFTQFITTVCYHALDMNLNIQNDSSYLGTPGGEFSSVATSSLVGNLITGNPSTSMESFV